MPQSSTAMFLPDESSKVLSRLHFLEERGPVDEIVALLEDRTPTPASAHLPAYRFALEYFDRHEKFPDFAYIRANFPELGLDIEAQGEFSPNLIEDFLFALRLEIAKERGQEALYEGNFAELVQICESMRGAAKVREAYRASHALEEYKTLLAQPRHGIMTGIHELDDVVGGFSRGTLTTVAAPPGHGKSTFVTNMAYNGLRAGFHQVILTYETSKRAFTYNLLSRHSAYKNDPIKASFLHKQTLRSPEQLKKLEALVEEMDQLQSGTYPVPDPAAPPGSNVTRPNDGRLMLLTGADVPGYDPWTLNKLWRELDEQMDGLDVIYVDYVNLLRFFRPKGTEPTQFVNDLITYFALLSRDFKGKRGEGLIVVLLCQVNRKGIERLEIGEGEKGADLTLLAEFNAFERDSHVVLVLLSTLSMRAGNSMKIQAIKNRTGPTMESMTQIYADFSTGTLGTVQFDQLFDLDEIADNDLGVGVPEALEIDDDDVPF